MKGVDVKTMKETEETGAIQSLKIKRWNDFFEACTVETSEQKRKMHIPSKRERISWMWVQDILSCWKTTVLVFGLFVLHVTKQRLLKHFKNTRLLRLGKLAIKWKPRKKANGTEYTRGEFHDFLENGESFAKHQHHVFCSKMDRRSVK